MYSSKVTPANSTTNSKVSLKLRKCWNSLKLTNIKSNNSDIGLIQLENFTTTTTTKLNTKDFDFPINGSQFLLKLEALHRVAEDEELNYDILSSPPLSKRYYSSIQA